MQGTFGARGGMWSRQERRCTQLRQAPPAAGGSTLRSATGSFLLGRWSDATRDPPGLALRPHEVLRTRLEDTEKMMPRITHVPSQRRHGSFAFA